MSFPRKIQAILKYYDEHKGFFSSQFDHPAVKVLRNLTNTDKTDFLELCLCFIKDPSEPSDPSFQVLKEVLNQLGVPNSKVIKVNRALIILSSLYHRSICSAHIPNLLDYKDLEAVIAHVNPTSLADALETLQNAKLLSSENKVAVIAHVDPTGLADALEILQNAKLLTLENKAAVIAHADPSGLSFALRIFDNAKLLTLENKAAVIAHADPTSLLDALNILQNAKLLTTENSSAVLAHADPATLADTLYILQNAYLLPPKTRAVFIAKVDPVFITLMDAGRRSELEDLSGFQQQILESPVYKQCCTQNLRHSARFFSVLKVDGKYLSEHRNDNPKTEQAYGIHSDIMSKCF